jgi:AcrR family transcriptional regulator
MPSSTRQRVPRAEREQTMLDAASRMFAAHGFHDASMDAVAAEADISKPMLYNYFGSKEGLYAACVHRSSRALLERMRSAAPAAASARDRLWAGTLAFFDYVEDDRAGWVVLHKEASSGGGSPAAEIAASRSRIARMIVRLFEGVDAPKASLTPADREAVAHAFVGAGESLANWWLEHPEEPKERVAGLLMRVAEHALAG